MMRSKILSVLLVLSVVFSVPRVIFANEYTFRKTVWGMSKEQVIESEGRAPDDTRGSDIAYKTKVAGKNAELYYKFVGNQLSTAQYLITDKHSNNNLYIDDYDNLEELLIKKYGSPKDKKTIWRNDLYKDEHQFRGMAIALGHLLYSTRWETSDTKVDLLLLGDNFEIFLGINYDSKELAEIKKEAKEKESLEQL